MTMVFEKDFYEMLLENEEIKQLFSSRVYFEEADDFGAFPYAVLSSVFTGATREVRVFKPLLQFDVYDNNQFSPLELAEQIIAILEKKSCLFGNSVFMNIRSERRRILRVDKNVWKVPIEITFTCRSS